ncbi:hypothetical protein D3C81_1468030 [compost metagenome]
MVDVVLQEQVGAADLLADVQRLLGVVQVEAGDVEGVDHLHDQLDARRFQLVGGVLQVVQEGVLDGRAVVALRTDTGQAVDLLVSQHLGVGDGLVHAGAEFLDAIRMAGNAALALGPIAGGQVEQHLFEAIGIQLRLDLLGWEIIGEQVFDTAETGCGSGFEAVEEVHLGEQHGQVGAETGHC